jgi:hypothetical protein
LWEYTAIYSVRLSRRKNVRFLYSSFQGGPKVSLEEYNVALRWRPKSVDITVNKTSDEPRLRCVEDHPLVASAPYDNSRLERSGVKRK